MQWFIPAVNGDIRFEPTDDDTCRLIVTDPSILEQEALRRWTRTAQKNGWIDNAAAKELRGTGTTSLRIASPLAPAAAAFCRVLKRRVAGVLTAFSYAGGKLETTEALEPEHLARAAQKAAEKGATAAVTVSRPSLSCPECQGASEPDRRACEVLTHFLTPKQRAQWERHRAVSCVGNRTGHTYLVMARDTERAKRIGRTVVDLDDRAVLHNYLWTVPPAEEVLADVLILQTREHWLRVSGEVDVGGDRMARGVATPDLPFGTRWDSAFEA